MCAILNPKLRHDILLYNPKSIYSIDSPFLFYKKKCKNVNESSTNTSKELSSSIFQSL